MSSSALRQDIALPAVALRPSSRLRLREGITTAAVSIDGDTIDVDVDLGSYVWIRKQRVRLVDIDAPKPKGDTRREGLAATEHLKSLIDGESIILRTDKWSDGGDREDSFGRWLGTIYRGDMDVNAEVIQSGHAVAYEYR